MIYFHVFLCVNLDFFLRSHFYVIFLVNSKKKYYIDRIKIYIYAKIGVDTDKQSFRVPPLLSEDKKSLSSDAYRPYLRFQQSKIYLHNDLKHFASTWNKWRRLIKGL